MEKPDDTRVLWDDMTSEERVAKGTGTQCAHCNEIDGAHRPTCDYAVPTPYGVSLETIKRGITMTEREQVFKAVTKMRAGGVTAQDTADEIASILGVSDGDADLIREILEDSDHLPTVEAVVNEIDNEFEFYLEDYEDDEGYGYEDEDDGEDDDDSE